MLDQLPLLRRPSAKIPKCQVVEKKFWTRFHLSQFSTRWGRSAITLGGCQSQGINNYHKYWFIAQVPRKKLETDGYEGTTWEIIFKLDKVNKKGTYKLRVALASTSLA